MKKIITLAIICALGIMTLAGCGFNAKDKKTELSEKETVDKVTTIRIGGLKGPTSMGMVKLMKDNEKGTTVNDYEFTIAASADEVVPKLIKGELDMAAIPANLASVLYNNSKGNIQVLAINTLGVVYIVENSNTIQSVADLKGKTIYATGKGTAPEYALSHILKGNGLDPDKDVTIEWKSEPTEVVALMKQNPNSIAMLPQPFVTVAQSSVEGLRIALDLTKEWENISPESACVTGVLVANKTFVNENKDAVDEFLSEYKVSANYTTEKIEEAAALIEEYNIIKAEVAKKAIPFCNITFLEGTDMKEKMEGYLKVLFEQMPDAVGGAMPEDDFYYER